MRKYNKLVRDKIPEYIKGKGETARYHIADEKEYWQKLKEKLLEEVEEFKVDESIGEFVDLLEVMDAIADHKNFGAAEIKQAREKKAREKGRFAQRIVLDES